MPRGGLRNPKGGRPKGAKDGPGTLRALKHEAKELYEQELVRVLANLRAGSMITDRDRSKAINALVKVQMRFAVLYRDSRALHDMLDRLVGKVPLPLEHSLGDGGPITLDVRYHGISADAVPGALRAHAAQGSTKAPPSSARR